MFLVGDALDEHVLDFRLRLHRSGFYEIGVPTESGEIDFTTVDVSPARSMHFRGSGPGVPRTEGGYLTHCASRTAFVARRSDPWRSVAGCAGWDSRTGVSSDDPGTTLLIRDGGGNGRPASEWKISGVARPTPGDPEAHAALVACYGGPRDDRMYAACVDFSRSTSPRLTLWRVSGGWTRLLRAAIPRRNAAHGPGDGSVPFWLKATADAVSIGSGDEVLATCRDQSLPRSPLVGIRLHGRAAAPADIRINDSSEQAA
jgi:hypothetical protein